LRQKIALNLHQKKRAGSERVGSASWLKGSSEAASAGQTKCAPYQADRRARKTATRACAGCAQKITIKNQTEVIRKKAAKIIGKLEI
jgi:hypothetical protein